MAKSAKTADKGKDSGRSKAEESDDEQENESTKDRPAADSPEELARVRKRNTVIASVFVALTTASIGFVGWHRPRDPGRVWLEGATSRHNDKIARRLTQCFGGETAAQIRTNIAEVRRGTLSTTMRTCRGSVLTELLATPLAVAGELGTPPGYADSGRRRAWDAYSRLQSALRAYDRAMGAVPEGQNNVPEAARDALASSIDDIAADAESTRNAINDLRNIVESNASWY